MKRVSLLLLLFVVAYTHASCQQGPSGIRGPPGYNGTNGVDGVNGVDGTNGVDGASITGATGPRGATGAAGSAGGPGAIGPVGATGAAGATGAMGPTGPSGKDGMNGTSIVGDTGPTGPAGTTTDSSYAEYVHLIASPNSNVPPGTALTVDTEVVNTVPSSIVMVTSCAGGTGWTLNGAGTYIVDYETSLVGSSSVALYMGADCGSLAIDTNTISGSTTSTTWIHGRAAVVVPDATPVIFVVSSVVGNADVTTAGSAAGFFVIRVSILKTGAGPVGATGATGPMGSTVSTVSYYNLTLSGPWTDPQGPYNISFTKTGQMVMVALPYVLFATNQSVIASITSSNFVVDPSLLPSSIYRASVSDVLNAASDGGDFANNQSPDTWYNLAFTGSVGTLFIYTHTTSGSFSGSGQIATEPVTLSYVTDA
jgi:hypothetical protein